MALLAMLLLPVMAAQALALTPGDAALTLVKPIANSVNLDPLPNPFPIPNTTITLDFVYIPSFVPPILPNDTIMLLDSIRSYFTNQIVNHGDGPIMDQVFRLGNAHVQMEWSSRKVPTNPFTYGDALFVLIGFRIKLSKEGYVCTVAEVLRTGDLENIGEVTVEYVGENV